MFFINNFYPQGYLLLSLFGGFVLLIGLFIKSKEDTIFPKHYWIPILFIPASSFTLLYFLITKCILSESEYIFVLSFVVLNFMTYIFLYSQITNLIQKKAEQQMEMEQNQFYKTQFSMMSRYVENMKEFQHDVKNMMLAVSTSQTFYHLEYFVNSGNAMIDNIIQYKLIENQHLNIQFHVNGMIPENLNVNILDIGIIIGNLLDNALEAVSQIETRWINLNITYSKGRLLIHICNPYLGKILYHNNRIITTKNDPCNHGLGLKRIDAIVKKYNGLMKIHHEHQQFTVKIIMYLE